MTAGEVARFATAMTGELFALLRGQGLLARQLGGQVADGAAFRDGVRRGAAGDLATGLFGIRAASVLGMRADADAASYASGLLIGADVAPRVEDGTIHILADAGLGTLYAAAIETLGSASVLCTDKTGTLTQDHVVLQRHTDPWGADSAEVHHRGIVDARGNVMVFMSHNSDISDAWEREGEDPRYFYQFSPKGYGVGINVMLYAMSH